MAGWSSVYESGAEVHWFGSALLHTLEKPLVARNYVRLWVSMIRVDKRVAVDSR